MNFGIEQKTIPELVVKLTDKDKSMLIQRIAIFRNMAKLPPVKEYDFKEIAIKTSDGEYRFKVE